MNVTRNTVQVFWMFNVPQKNHIFKAPPNAKSKEIQG